MRQPVRVLNFCFFRGVKTLKAAFLTDQLQCRCMFLNLEMGWSRRCSSACCIPPGDVPGGSDKYILLNPGANGTKLCISIATSKVPE